MTTQAKVPTPKLAAPAKPTDPRARLAQISAEKKRLAVEEAQLAEDLQDE